MVNSAIVLKISMKRDGRLWSDFFSEGKNNFLNEKSSQDADNMMVDIGQKQGTETSSCKTYQLILWVGGDLLIVKNAHWTHTQLSVLWSYMSMCLSKGS